MIFVSGCFTYGDLLSVVMGDKINREYFAPGAAAFNYNVVCKAYDTSLYVTN